MNVAELMELLKQVDWATTAEGFRGIIEKDRVVVQHVEVGTVAATEMVIADQAIRHVFSASCSPLLDRIEANKQESRNLAATRDLLLPKLITGEIRVRDAEKAVENIL